jgi:hypothetical protein
MPKLRDGEIIIRPQKIDLEERRRVEALMSPSLRRAGDKLAENVKRDFASAVKRHWHLGKLIMDAVDKETDKEQALRFLRIYTSVSQAYINQWCAFYRAFRNDDDINYLIAARRKTFNDTPLSWMYIQKLLTVNDPTQIRKLIEQTCDKDWEPEDLQKAIDKLMGRQLGDRHAGGRPIHVPHSVSGKLSNLQKVVRIIPRNMTLIYKNAEEGILKSIKEMPADKISNELVSEIESSATLVQTTIGSMQDLLNDLQQAQATAEERLSRQAQAQSVEDAEKLDGRAKK